jgi:hypothetical protein
MRMRTLTAAALSIGICLFAATPALAAQPPEAPTTQAASGVGGTVATLHGTLNPNANATAGWYFAYAPGANCTAGSSTPLETQAEVQAQKVLAHLIGLQPSTTYTACLVATHETEEGLLQTPGPQVTFKTTRAAPAIDAEATTAITPFEAAVEASVNPEREDATCSVEYGPTAAYGSLAPCEPADLGGGFGDQPAAAHLTGLQPATTYFFRVTAENATGTSEGEGGQFTTLPALAPDVEGESVAAVTPTRALVEAQVNTRSQETTFHVEYATNSEFTEATTGAAGTLPAGPLAQPTGPRLLASTLTPGTRYFYRVVAENATGVTVGETEELSTVGLPIVHTGEAQGASRTSAALTGTLNPQGAPTSYRFLYIAQAGYEAAVAAGAGNPYGAGAATAAFSLPAGAQAEPVGPVAAGELAAGTVYHYALTATNEAGTTLGQDRTFETAPATPPTVATGGAVEVTQSTARLTGTIDAQGLPAVYRFELETQPGVFTAQAAANIGPGAPGVEAVTGQVAYLAPANTYRYRLCASNEDGTVCGPVEAFTTASYPPLTPPSSAAFADLTGVRPISAPPSTITPAPLSRPEKLAKALRGCRRSPKGVRRRACEGRARTQYGPVGKRKR